MPWCCEDEESVESLQLLNRVAQGAELYVPAIWHYELLSSLAVAERRGRISAAQSAAFLTRIEPMHIRVMLPPPARRLRALADLSRTNSLPTTLRISIWRSTWACRSPRWTRRFDRPRLPLELWSFSLPRTLARP